MITVASLPTIGDVRQHVLQLLCMHDNLDPEQTPMFEGLITRSGRPCGLFFQVQGPRRLRTYALWASDEHRILFYDSTGMRFRESRLSEAPEPPAAKRAA
jgi:hypothetical protein